MRLLPAIDMKDESPPIDDMRAMDDAVGLCSREEPNVEVEVEAGMTLGLS